MATAIMIILAIAFISAIAYTGYEITKTSETSTHF